MRKEPDAALPSLTRWPLRGPHLLERLPASTRNINLLVEDSDGSRYVLRGCTRNPSRERLIFQLEFQDHLRRHGIPVPQVVMTEAGERCVESSPASLLDFLDDWRSAATRDLPLRVVEGLPRSWLHSDFRPSNVLFAGDQVQAVLDFDVVHRGFRLEDIAYATFSFCRQGRSSAVIDAEASAIFQQVFDLTEPERRALPYFIVAVQARTAARYRVRAREGTDPREALCIHIRRMRALSVMVGGYTQQDPVDQRAHSSSLGRQSG